MSAAVDAVPAWVADAVFYQIFPDRFARHDGTTSQPYCQPWGASPTQRGFQCGTLPGIRRKLDYLLDLGINAIYLNPIFLAPSNHRYDTTDYFRIDPKLGTLADFRELLQEAHQTGVRIILDGVFNHVGRGFFAFADLLENQAESPYRDWFTVHHFPVDAYTPGEAHSYAAWWGHKSLPKLNTQNPDVRRFLMSVARYWTEQGIDGWRLDVPNEIDDDLFWGEFRSVVRSVNPEAYLVGEIWDVNPRWVGPQHFDGLMNYPLRKHLIQLVCGKTRPEVFTRRFEASLAAYPPENHMAMYNLLGSHDRERILTLFEGDTARVRLANLILFGLPGAPAVYNGDEIGVEGGKDPDCRRAFPWDESMWDQDSRSWIQRLIAIRKGCEALRRGSYQTVPTDQKDLLAFRRNSAAGDVLVIANPGEYDLTACFDFADLGWQPDRRVIDLMSTVTVKRKPQGFTIRLQGFAGAYLTQGGEPA